MKKVYFLFLFFFNSFSSNKVFENYNDVYLKTLLISSVVGFAGEIFFYKSEEITPRILLTGSTVACTTVNNIKITARQVSADALGLVEQGAPVFRNIYGVVFSGMGVCSGMALAHILKKIIFNNFESSEC